MSPGLASGLFRSAYANALNLLRLDGHRPETEMSDKEGKPPADTSDPGSDFSEVSFQRLGQRIADLSRELSDITKLAGQAAPRKLELEAATNAFKSLADAYSKKP